MSQNVGANSTWLSCSMRVNSTDFLRSFPAMTSSK